MTADGRFRGVSGWSQGDPPATRRAADPLVPRRDSHALEPAAWPRGLCALRRSGGGVDVVARAVPRPQPRDRAAPAPRQRRAAGLLSRGRDRAHDHAAAPLPHEGRRAPRARPLRARPRLRAPPPRPHVRACAARRDRRVLRCRSGEDPRRLVPRTWRARRSCCHVSVPTDSCATGGTNGSASDADGCSRWRAPARTAPRRSSPVGSRGTSEGRRSCGSRHPTARSHAWPPPRSGMSPMHDGTRRAIVAAFIANLGIAIAEVRRVRHHRIGIDARGVDPLGCRHGQPRPAVPRRATQPPRADGGAPVRLRPGAVLLGVRRGAGAVLARVAVRARGRRRQAAPSRSTRFADRRLHGARHRDRVGGVLVAHRAPRSTADAGAEPIVVALHPHHEERRDPGGAARGHRRAHRPRRSRCSGSRWRRSPATHVGTPPGASGSARCSVSSRWCSRSR